MKLGVCLDDFDVVYIDWDYPIIPRIGEVIVALECFLPSKMVRRFQLDDAAEYPSYMSKGKSFWETLMFSDIYVEDIGWSSNGAGNPIPVLYLDTFGKYNVGETLIKNNYGLRFDHDHELGKHLSMLFRDVRLPAVGRNSIENRYHCETVEDILAVMLTHQKRGLLQIRNIGIGTIKELEKSLTKMGILKIIDGTYYSDLCYSHEISETKQLVKK